MKLKKIAVWAAALTLCASLTACSLTVTTDNSTAQSQAESSAAESSEADAPADSSEADAPAEESSAAQQTGAVPALTFTPGAESLEYVDYDDANLEKHPYQDGVDLPANAVITNSAQKLIDCPLYIDGMKFSADLKLSDLLNAGWEADRNLDEITVEAHTELINSFQFTNAAHGKAVISVSPCNRTDADVKAADSGIASLTIMTSDNSPIGDALTVNFPNGITQASTYDEFVAKLGRASSDGLYSVNYTGVTYKYDKGSTDLDAVELVFDKTAKQPTKISLKIN